jgi:hypothetical protein
MPEGKDDKKKTSTKMTAHQFGQTKGFNRVYLMTVKKLYGEDEKPASYWEKVLKKDFVFN